MKEIEELTERINGADELIDSLIKKITELEKKEIKVTDYSLHFAALQKIFEVFLVRYNKESNDLNAAFEKLNIEYPAEQIKQGLAEIKTILSAIQKSLPVKVRHQLDPKTKGLVIAGVILLIVIAICVGLCGHLWTENNRLQASDLKYRLVRQVDSVGTKWADSVYTSNPDKAAKTVVRMESEKITKDKPSKIKISKRRKEPRKRLR